MLSEHHIGPLIFVAVALVMLPSWRRAHDELRQLRYYAEPRSQQEAHAFVLGEVQGDHVTCMRTRATGPTHGAPLPLDLGCWFPCGDRAYPEVADRFGLGDEHLCDDPSRAHATDMERWRDRDDGPTTSMSRSTWEELDRERRRLATPVAPHTTYPYRWSIWHDNGAVFVRASAIVPDGWWLWGH